MAFPHLQLIHSSKSCQSGSPLTDSHTKVHLRVLSHLSYSFSSRYVAYPRFSPRLHIDKVDKENKENKETVHYNHIHGTPSFSFLSSPPSHLNFNSESRLLFSPSYEPYISYTPHISYPQALHRGFPRVNYTNLVARSSCVSSFRNLNHDFESPSPSRTVGVTQQSYFSASGRGSRREP